MHEDNGQEELLAYNEHLQPAGRKFRIIFAVWALGFSFAVSLALVQARANAREGHIAKIALCSFRADLARRVQTSEDYLRDNPKGFPGIPLSVLQKSIQDQRDVLYALRILRCK